MVGRPTIRTPALEDRIIEQLADGIPLMQIARQEGMPALRTIYDWAEADPKGFGARFAHAREDGMDAIAVDALNIADNRNQDFVDDGKGNMVIDHNAIARDKLRVDTRLKLLSCWAAGRYGNKVEVAGRVTLEQLVGASLPAPSAPSE